ncbi:MAG TPA: kinase [Stellaceae bacterium]|nr:kinase [Stellaceae bacterium]
MIISRTPFRISLFGGGTDYPAWYRRNGGAVLGTTINKYCYISLRVLPPFFEHRHRIAYSKIETVREIAEIQHPAVRAVLQQLDIKEGLEIHHDGDLPARSGLGSSSAFTVGLLNAIAALRGQMMPARELALNALHIEQDVLRESVGSQDQIWAAYGGTNLIDFRPDGTFQVAPLIMTPDRRKELQASMMLFFTGLSRFAPEIAAKKIANFAARESELKAMAAMVPEAAAILGDDRRPLKEIGALLHESWQLKRQLADAVSTPAIDEIYEAGRAAGAVGGKLLGAGGGGFLLFFVDPAKRQALRERLAKLIEVSVEIGSPGSKIVVYEPSGLENS